MGDSYEYITRINVILTLSIFQLYYNRVLREAKTSTENELNQLRLRNDALTAQLSMAQQALLNTANDKNNVISELRAELKMKSFELTTLGVSFEVLFYLFLIPFFLL